MSEPEIENLVLFCRALREHGLAVTPSEVVAAVTTLRLIDTSDREEVFLSLRSVLTTRVDDFPIFEELFETFWNRLPEKLVERETSFKLQLKRSTSFAKTHGHGARFFSRELDQLARRPIPTPLTYLARAISSPAPRKTSLRSVTMNWRRLRAWRADS